MDNKDDYLKVNLFDNGMILEELAVSAADLIKSGYKKLDEKTLSKLSPLMKVVEGVGFQQLMGQEFASNAKRVLEGSYRCIVDGKVLKSDRLVNAKGFENLKRGFVRGKDTIKAQAYWEKIEPSELSASMTNVPVANIVGTVYMVMSIATSQYYLHEINSNYENICVEIESLRKQFDINDDSEILAGQKTVIDMVNHFDSIMENPDRRQNESVNAGQLVFDALKQIERTRLKIEKNYHLDSKNDSIDVIENNVNGMINALAQLKTAIYIYGMSKGLKVCFDGVDSSEEVNLYINEINEQIDSYNQTATQVADTLNSYLAESKEVGAVKAEELGKLAPALLLGPLVPALAVGYTAKKMGEKSKRDAQLVSLGEKVNAELTLSDIECLSKSVVFLEEYAESFDSTLEIVSCDGEYYIGSKSNPN